MGNNAVDALGDRFVDNRFVDRKARQNLVDFFLARTKEKPDVVPIFSKSWRADFFHKVDDVLKFHILFLSCDKENEGERPSTLLLIGYKYNCYMSRFQ